MVAKVLIASTDHLPFNGTNPNSEQCNAMAGGLVNLRGMKRSLCENNKHIFTNLV
jgi:hypothetical protein